MSPKNESAALNLFSNCILNTVAGEIERKNEEISFLAKVRTDLANHFEHYTCNDYDLPSSQAEYISKWVNSHGQSHIVKVLHQRPASRIHVIENFISEQQCATTEKEAKKTLHHATVADGKGGSEYSPSRKAMQAGVSIPWHLEKEDNCLVSLLRKIYEYTNDVLGLNIEGNGQEDLMSIQYTGRGENDTEPDQYMPHCDGDCTGLPFMNGTRVATMVMYCQTPDKGGATNFRNSGIHIVPKQGTAVFFSYVDPDTLMMDTGFTEHSGCPVIKGEKKIVAQWIRLGVDMENPWDSYNTCE